MKLEKCPFCGAIPERYHCFYKIYHKENCYMGVETLLHPDNEITAWNTRVYPWIRCEDGLPEEEGRYFILYKYGNIPEVKAFINEYYPIEKRWANVLYNIRIVAWMPIPEFKED